MPKGRVNSPISIPKSGITHKSLASRLGVTARTIYRWTAQGRIPKPHKLDKTCIFWDEAQVSSFEEKLKTKKTWR